MLTIDVFSCTVSRTRNIVNPIFYIEDKKYLNVVCCVILFLRRHETFLLTLHGGSGADQSKGTTKILVGLINVFYCSYLGIWMKENLHQKK